MAKAVSTTIEPVNSVTSDYINSSNFAMGAFAREIFPVELVPCSDGWRRTLLQTMYMMPGLPDFCMPQCK
jgi:hypothetical protein